MHLGECEGVGGLQEEQASKREGKRVRQGPDDEYLPGHGGGGSGFYPNGCKQAMDTARGPQQKDDQTPALERTLAAELTVDWKAAVLEKTLWQPR